MHDEVSETENIRKNLAIERMIVEGCEILLDTSQTFVRQGKFTPTQKHIHEQSSRKGPQIPNKSIVYSFIQIFFSSSLVIHIITCFSLTFLDLFFAPQRQ